MNADFLRDAGYLEAGPVHFYPALNVAVGHDDNIFQSNQHTQSSTFTRTSPEISAVLPLNIGYWQLGAQATDIRYSDSSDDNFTDRFVYARGNLEANARNQFKLDASLAKKHDPRGTYLTEGFDPLTSTIDEPDEFTEQKAAFSYEYGAPGAQGKLRFGADYLDHSYDNHRDRTRFFDRDEYGVRTAFLWRVQPRTSILLEARERRIEYEETDPAESTLDSREHSLLAGAEWGVTGSTTGGLRLGNLRKEFDAADRVDGSDFIWEANLDWRPRKYSTFSIELQRLPNETNGVGDFIDTKSSVVRWSHDWTSRVASELALSYIQQEYKHSDRESETSGATLGLSYKMRRWLTWRLNGTWHSRSSNNEELEFERTRYWITAEFRL